MCRENDAAQMSATAHSRDGTLREPPLGKRRRRTSVPGQAIEKRVLATEHGEEQECQVQFQR